MKFLFLSLVILGACVTRQEVQGDIFKNDGIPASICSKYPEVKKYGIYRVVLCSSKPSSPQCQHGEVKFEEFRPYCSSSIKEYLGVWIPDAERWLGDITVPK